jgi:hypothetical protein
MSKLKEMDKAVSDGPVVHFIMSTEFVPSKISYNTRKEKKSIIDLISYCIEEDKRRKVQMIQGLFNGISPAKRKHQGAFNAKKKLQFSKAGSSESKASRGDIVSLLQKGWTYAEGPCKLQEVPL